MVSGGQNFDDLTGKKFFRLNVIERVENKEYFYPKYKRYFVQTRYLCECECGNHRIASRSSLINAKVKSCGCYKKEISSEKAKKILIKYPKINGKIIKEHYKLARKNEIAFQRSYKD